MSEDASEEKNQKFSEELLYVTGSWKFSQSS